MKTLLALSLTLFVATAGCKKKPEGGAAPVPTAAGSAAAGSGAAGSGAAGSAGGSAAAGSADTAGSAAAGSADAAGSAAAGSAAAAGDGVAIGSYAPKVGDKGTKTNDQTMMMTLPVGEMKMVKHTEETREVLAVEGTVITKVKMTYGVHTETQTMGGKTKDKPSPIAGKSYIVSRKDGAIEATLADGSAVSAAELEELKDENKRLGKPDAMDQIVASKTWKIGEKVVFTPDELAAINKRGADAGDAEKFVTLTMTLTAVDAGMAMFAMEIAMATTLPKGSLEIGITGTSRLDIATGRVSEVNGTGPVKGDMGMPVTGTMTMKTAYTY